MKLKIPLLTLFALCAGCGRTHILSDSIIQDVKISDLSANADLYNNAIVRVRGAAVMRFEANFICSDAAEIGTGNNTKCLWLSPIAHDDALAPLDARLYHNKVVVIVGVFDKDFPGLMGAYGGAIAPISVKVVGSHDKGDVPAPPPEPPAQP